MERAHDVSREASSMMVGEMISACVLLIAVLLRRKDLPASVRASLQVSRDQLLVAMDGLETGE